MLGIPWLLRQESSENSDPISVIMGYVTLPHDNYNHEPNPKQLMFSAFVLGGNAEISFRTAAETWF